MPQKSVAFYAPSCALPHLTPLHVHGYYLGVGRARGTGSFALSVKSADISDSLTCLAPSISDQKLMSLFRRPSNFIRSTVNVDYFLYLYRCFCVKLTTTWLNIARWDIPKALWYSWASKRIPAVRPRPRVHSSKVYSTRALWLQLP